MTRYLALDGPLNGSYIDERTARENGYVLILWQSGEEAWLHSSSTLAEPVEIR